MMPRSRSTEALLQDFGLTDDDLEAVQAFGEIEIPRIDELVSAFYDWLETRPEFAQFFSDAATLARVKRLQGDYWTDLLRGEIDEEYVLRRRTVGETHVRIKLPVEVYFSAMNFSMTWFLDCVRDQKLPPKQSAKTRRALRKLLVMDLMLVLDTIGQRHAETIGRQSRALMELSTPFIQLWDEVLLLPLIGVIDTARAQQIMENLLQAVVETKSRVAIVDVTGVPTVDTLVAEHLLKAVAAGKMLGAQVMVTGISPHVAQSIIKLGIDLSTLQTHGTLQAGVAAALALIGKHVVSREEGAR